MDPPRDLQRARVLFCTFGSDELCDAVKTLPPSKKFVVQ